MKLKFLRIIPLLIICIAAYFLISSYTGDVEFEPVQIFSVNIEDINGISVSLKDTENSFELVKDGERWFFSDDKSLKVLQSKAHSLSYDISHIFGERMIDRKGLNLQQYGLDPAVSIVTVKLNDGSMKEFHIGNRLDNGREYYFKTGDSPEIYTLYIGKGQMFTSTRQDFIDKKLSYITRENIKKITVYNSLNEKTVIEKLFSDDSSYIWNVVEPIRWNVLESQLESRIIYPLISLQAKNFDETLNSNADFEKNASGCIEVEMLDGTVTAFYISEKNSEGLCYVTAGDYYPALVDTKLSEIYNFRPELIFNKRIALLHSDEFLNVKFVSGDKKYICYSSENNEYFINDNRVSEEEYLRFTDTASELTCGDIIYEENLIPLNIYIEYSANDNTSAKFEFYKQNDEIYAVTRDGETFLEVNAYNFEQWLNKLLLTL